jgi:predicted glycosyltransferase
MTGRILIHVQHLLGTGHLRRAAAIGAAAAELDFDVEIVSGGLPIAGLGAGRARIVQLPPLRSLDAGFKHLVGETGAPIDDAWKSARRELLLARLAEFRPDVLITELFPFGRRALEFELIPLLKAAQEMTPRPLVLSSLRDILVTPGDAVKVERAIARVRQSYDRVLVHGDPALIDLPASYPPAAALGEYIVYTGYVPSLPSPNAPPGDGVDEIVVSAGGSAVGARLLETALAARLVGTTSERTWRLLFGPDLPAAARQRLQAEAGPRVVVEPARQDFPSLLRRCHVSVSQAGYNTVMDVLDARARAVLVPFATEGETEQTQRAGALAQKGWTQVVHEHELNATSLRAAVDRAAAMDRPDTGVLDRDGAAATARCIRDLLSQRRPLV